MVWVEIFKNILWETMLCIQVYIGIEQVKVSKQVVFKLRPEVHDCVGSTDWERKSVPELGGTVGESTIAIVSAGSKNF